MAVKILINFLLVGLGGAVGSACRYASSLWLNPSGSGLPWGTLLANVAGCFVIGFVTEMATLKVGLSPEARLLLATGFCGGLTTLSSLVFEANGLLRDRAFFLALVYGLITLAGAFIALWAGMLLCRGLLIRD